MLEVKRVMPWILLEREKVAGETSARCFMVTVLATFILGQAVRPCKKQTTYWRRRWISAETHLDARLSDKSLDVWNATSLDLRRVYFSPGVRYALACRFPAMKSSR